jgi:pimeloyl-ACP methyl ester carboxylesterase
MRIEFFSPVPQSAEDKRPVIVFLHGLFGDLGNFSEAAAFLQSEFPVLTPPLPLFQTTNPEPSLSGLLWWLDMQLTKLDAGKLCLVGNSLGGQLACLYAAFRPQQVHSLVLTGAAGMGEVSMGISRPRRFDREYLKAKARTTFFNLEPDESLINAIVKVVQNPPDVHRLLALSRDSMRTRLDGMLEQITCPVLLIWGENDSITPPACAEAFESVLLNVKKVMIPQCGHAPMMEHPQIFARHVAQFLSQIPVKPEEEIV